MGRNTTSSARVGPGTHPRIDSSGRLETKDRPSTEHGQVGTAGASNKPRVGGRDQQRTEKTLKAKEGTRKLSEKTLTETDKTEEGKEMVHERNGKTVEGEVEEPPRSRAPIDRYHQKKLARPHGQTEGNLHKRRDKTQPGREPPLKKSEPAQARRNEEPPRKKRPHKPTGEANPHRPNKTNRTGTRESTEVKEHSQQAGTYSESCQETQSVRELVSRSRARFPCEGCTRCAARS